MVLLVYGRSRSRGRFSVGEQSTECSGREQADCPSVHRRGPLTGGYYQALVGNRKAPSIPRRWRPSGTHPAAPGRAGRAPIRSARNPPHRAWRCGGAGHRSGKAPPARCGSARAAAPRRMAAARPPGPHHSGSGCRTEGSPSQARTCWRQFASLPPLRRRSLALGREPGLTRCEPRFPFRFHR